MDYRHALEKLKANGYKFTGKREMMVQLFAEENRYLSAKEVLDHMQKTYPGLSFDTVYRNLSLFEDLGILEGTDWDGERRYRFRCEGDTHHHHLICTECGRTRKLEICPMNAILGQPEDFHITGHRFEIYGRCVDCDQN
ncbi:zinc-specific metallo-regulatory protein [Polycladomyces abyssicola]|uniref:Zinc-specific metallo-regulatory protein n=1 Tax=Polycladomyces abyssicola TaxID=1125966 RepID=A0A8D5UCY3_9BACL|nr:Fur family transcriptional regulator [Polycladomyces abyssicola]BCU80241.1 zinc-specific metallo-regulatory protein [Polycladomyces abyssicola]